MTLVVQTMRETQCDQSKSQHKRLKQSCVLQILVSLKLLGKLDVCMCFIVVIIVMLIMLWSTLGIISDAVSVSVCADSCVI